MIIKPLFYSSWLVLLMANNKKNWLRINANSGNKLKTRSEKKIRLQIRRSVPASAVSSFKKPHTVKTLNSS